MAPDDDIPDDRTAKQLIDEGTQADLERWFGLPSFDQLAAAAKPEAEPDESPAVKAVRERRAAAIAAVDPAMVDRHHARIERAEALVTFRCEIESRIDPSIARLDLRMIERQVAEPREIVIHEQLIDDLKECTPQALLRDLHRPELTFTKEFELVDMAASQRFDIVAAVAEGMRTSWKLPPLGISPVREGQQLIAELKADRARPWTDALKTLPNRRVTE